MFPVPALGFLHRTPQHPGFMSTQVRSDPVSYIPSRLLHGICHLQSTCCNECGFFSDLFLVAD